MTEAVQFLPLTEALRALRESVASELVTRMTALLDGSYDTAKAKVLADWLEATFHFKVTRTPRGQKVLKDKVAALWWNLKHGGSQREETVRGYWTADVLPHLADLVKHFSAEGGVEVPRELKLGANTYRNPKGFTKAQLQKFAKQLEGVFASLKGWRQRALTGGVTVVLASPDAFRGTAKGTYRSSEDVLYVRATPAVVKRTGPAYGGFEYIIVHELAHRYERKVGVSTDFDRQPWWTTGYSRKEGEAFAELFALGHFGTSPGAPGGDRRPLGPEAWETVKRFEQVMSGGPLRERRALTEATLLFDDRAVEALRKDYLLLMRNVDRVQDVPSMKVFREGAKHFGEHLDRLIFGEQSQRGGGVTPYLNALLQAVQPSWDRRRYVALSDTPEVAEGQTLFDREIRPPAWNLAQELRDAPGRYFNYDYKVADHVWRDDLEAFRKEAPKWKNRAAKHARALWKGLKLAAEHLRRIGTGRPGTLTYRSEKEDWLSVDVEGATVVIDTVAFPEDPKGPRWKTPSKWLPVLKAAMRHFKARSLKVLPWLWQRRLKFFVVEHSLDSAATYDKHFKGGPAITLGPSNFEGPEKTAKILAHEMAHHLYQSQLSGAQLKLWEAAVHSQTTQLSLRTLLDAWPEREGTLLGMQEQLRDPTLWLQVDVLIGSRRYGDTGKLMTVNVSGQRFDIFYRDAAVNAQQAGGHTWTIPAHPITGYGTTNAQEAFCEAVGLAVAYGPRALHSVNRHLLATVLGRDIRLESASAGAALAERSFTLSDIPKEFRIVFELGGSAEYGDARAWKALATGYFEGVTGVSDQGSIEAQWLGIGRDAVLVMPGQAFARLNKVTRILYDNPNYLLSKDAWALRRISQSDTRDRSRAIEHALRNLLSYVFGSMKRQGGKEYAEIVDNAEYCSLWGVLARTIAKQGTKIDGVKSVIRVIRAALKVLEKDRSYSWYVKELVGLTDAQWSRWIDAGAKEVATIFGDEGEWVLKGDKLQIPQGSTLRVLSVDIPPAAWARYVKYFGLSGKRPAYFGADEEIPDAERVHKGPGSFAGWEDALAARGYILGRLKALGIPDRYRVEFVSKAAFQKAQQTWQTSLPTRGELGHRASRSYQPPKGRAMERRISEAASPSEFLPALHGAVKNRQGAFASEKQARYLIQVVRGTSRSDRGPGGVFGDSLRRQLAPHVKDDRARYYFTTGSHVPGTAKQGYRTRITWYAWALDDAGVVFAVKLGSSLEPNFQAARVTYRRPAEDTRTADLGLDKEDDRRDAEIEDDRRSQQARIQGNQPLIQKIKGIDGWRRMEILTDFIAQLERGDTLTPRQMAVVMKYVPVEIGEHVDWKVSWAWYQQWLARRTETWNRASGTARRQLVMDGAQSLGVPERDLDAIGKWDISHWQPSDFVHFLLVDLQDEGGLRLPGASPERKFFVSMSMGGDWGDPDVERLIQNTLDKLAKGKSAGKRAITLCLGMHRFVQQLRQHRYLKEHTMEPITTRQAYLVDRAQGALDARSRHGSGTRDPVLDNLPGRPLLEVFVEEQGRGVYYEGTEAAIARLREGRLAKTAAGVLRTRVLEPLEKIATRCPKERIMTDLAIRSCRQAIDLCLRDE